MIPAQRTVSLDYLCPAENIQKLPDRLLTAQAVLCSLAEFVLCSCRL